MMLRVEKKGKALHVVGTFQGVRVRKSTGLPSDRWDKAEAERRRIEDAILAGTWSGGDGDGETATVDRAVSFYLEQTRVGVTSQTYAERMRALWGGLRVDQLRPHMLLTESAKSVRGGETVSSGTQRKVLVIWQAVLNCAWDNGLAERPTEWKLRKPAENPGRVRWLTVAERERFLGCCSESLWPLALFMFYTGARLGEALRLEWGHVNLLWEHVTLWSQKGRTKEWVSRQVDLHPRLVPVLRERQRGGGRVFLSEKGKPWASRSGVTNAWVRACEAAGIEDFSPHDARHTFASHLAMAGVDMATLAELMGHSSVEMTKRYAHLAPSHKRAAVERLAGEASASEPAGERLGNTPEGVVDRRGGEWQKTDTPRAGAGERGR